MRAALSIVFALGLATPAFAHSKAETTEPADGATVAAVEEMVIRFDGPMRVTRVDVTRDGEAVDLGDGVDPAPATEVRIVPASAMTRGRYDVEWRGLSEDGHVMSGSFGFDVAE